MRLGSGLGLAPDRRIRLGSGLGVSPDVSSLLQNLVRAGSALLDPGTKEHWEHWEQIQRGEGGVCTGVLGSSCLSTSVCWSPALTEGL
jgi:hypothetical protein